MNIDLARKFNLYLVLLAFVSLIMLLHTIRRVDIPLRRMMNRLNHKCKTLSSKIDSWSEYSSGINFAVDESKTFDSNRGYPGKYGSPMFKTANDIGNPVFKADSNGAGYDSFTEVLSDKGLNSKYSKRYSPPLEENMYEGIGTEKEEGAEKSQRKSAVEQYLEDIRDSKPLEYRKYGNEWLMTNNELSFLRAWCIQRDYRVNWRRILGKCKDQTQWTAHKPQWTASSVTAGALSYIFDVEIKPTGQFSRFFIQSVCQDGTKKTIGGDSWRIHIAGASSIPVTIVDHEDGTYEVLLLVMEPGYYNANIVLEYTLCDGMKDPPKDWFIKGNSQGKYQHPDVLPGYEHPYLLQQLPGGLNFTVTPSADSIFEEMSKNGILEKYCPNPACMMWDGFGRWVNNVWKPYVKEEIERDPTDHRDGMLWIYGDSNGDLFYKSLSKRPLCNELMAGCDHTYNWVYKIQEHNIKQAKMLWDSKDFSIDRVISELDDVLSDQRMNDHSVVIVNMGLHYVQGITFDSYQKLIERTIDLFTSHKNSPHGFHGKIIWKTTTALFRERYGDPKSGARHAKGLRFFTVPRVQLYNAYATSEMCRSGITVLDVYPISDSYPAGTGGVSKQWDAVHYENKCFQPVEDVLEEYLG